MYLKLLVEYAITNEDSKDMKTIFNAHTGSGNHGCEALVRSTTKLLGCRPMLFSTGYDEDIKYGFTEVA